MKTIIVLSLTFLCAIPLSGQVKRGWHGQYEYQVTVLDENNKPIEGAICQWEIKSATLEDNKIGTGTDTNGQAFFIGYNGQFISNVTVTKDGYIPVELTFDKEKSTGVETVILKKDPNWVVPKEEPKPEP